MHYSGNRPVRQDSGYHQNNNQYRKYAAFTNENQLPTKKTSAYPEDEKLVGTLHGLEGSQYPGYKCLMGEWKLKGYTIHFDKIQADPYAPPSRIRIFVPQSIAKFTTEYYNPKIRHTALADYITRQFDKYASRFNRDNSTDGEGGWSGPKGNRIIIEAPGQNVIERSSVKIDTKYVQIRCAISLPARGRRIEGHRAAELVSKGLISAIEGSAIFGNLDRASVYGHIISIEDQEALRDSLAANNLVAFVIDKARLPRKAGNDDRPSFESSVIPFKSPESQNISIELPNRGIVTGMGIKKGITIIVGSGFHGKSTLLESLQYGIYNKIPGDGREFVVSDVNAVKIRAEEGRPIHGLDIRNFFNKISRHTTENNFNTQNASGSTSQGANIIEAIELGASLLLMDEDTCATNFMFRDDRMESLIAPDKDSIIPFVNRIKDIYDKWGISAIIVMGSCSAFLPFATTVIQMREYLPVDKTECAHQIIANNPRPYDKIKSDNLFDIMPRLLVRDSLSIAARAKVQGIAKLFLDNSEIDTNLVEQLVETAQLKAIGDMMLMISSNKLGFPNPRMPLRRCLEYIFRKMNESENGLDILAQDQSPHGNYAMPRIIELGAAICRYRQLVVASNS